MTNENFLFTEDLSELDPDTDKIIAFEEERQAEKLILIPSESICPKAVRQALGCVFTNLYAEGYPSLRMTKYEREHLLDFTRQLSPQDWEIYPLQPSLPGELCQPSE